MGFLFDGKPIHPAWVREFEVSLADNTPPRVRSIDLESCALANQQPEPFQVRNDGFLDYQQHPGESEFWFAYRWLGQSPSGTHVLLVQSGGGGGTLVTTDVYLMRIERETYHDFPLNVSGPARALSRTVLKCIGQITVGDRDNGVVELQGDTLTLGKSQYRESAAVYRIP